jgi:hypothetical protein
MLGEGMRVRFVPGFNDSKTYTPEEWRMFSVTGKVVFINWEHENFCVEFEMNGTKQRETFLFRDVGQAVLVIG